MPPAATGSGKDSTTFMDDLAKRLDRLEEVLRGLVGKVDDIDQQQQGLSVAVLRLKKLVSGTGANNLMDSLPEITLPGAASGVPGDSLSAAPRSTNGHPGLPPHRHQTMGTSCPRTISWISRSTMARSIRYRGSTVANTTSTFVGLPTTRECHMHCSTSWTMHSCGSIAWS
jgi:hypothetical protein